MDRIGQRWPSYAVYAPWLMLVIGTVLALSTPPWLNASPLLALTCVTAGVITTLRTTVRVSVAALIMSVVTDTLQGGFEGPEDISSAFYVALAGLIGLDLNRLLARYGGRLRAVRSVAEAAQHALLPEPPASVAGFGIAASYRAAQQDALIGGDLYAVADTSHGLRVLVGDVRGKGMGAVSTVSLLLGSFRERAEEAATLMELADRLDSALTRSTGEEARPDALETFTTAVLAELPRGGGQVELLNCGHPAPYAVTTQGVRRLESADFNLPLGTGLEPSRTASTVFPLPPETSLVFVTDGVTEARNARGTFFDPLLGLRSLPSTSPATVLNTLITRVDSWAESGTTDDMAILVIGVDREDREAVDGR